MNIDELDLKILKGLVADKVNSLTFSYNYDTSLFDEDTRPFARVFLEYVKSFKAVPTLRTLQDAYSGKPDLQSVISDAWEQIEQYEYDVKEYPYDLSLMKKRYQHNAVEKIKEKVETETPDDPERFFKTIELEIQRVVSLDITRSKVQRTVGDYVDEFASTYEARTNNPEKSVSIKTGYSMIDAITDGVAPGELFMIGGESNSGKSQMLNNMAKQIWLQGNTIENCEDFQRGYNVLYFSLEMPYEDCFIRFLASLANVPQRSLSKQTLEPDECLRVEQAYKFIKAYQNHGYYFDIVDVPRNLTIEEVEASYNEALLRYGPDVVIIDYMGLMHSTTFAREADWLKLGAISASLHEFSRAYNCAVITAAQLTDLKRGGKGSDEENKRVGMHRWGRSSLIMHHVNVGIQIETRPNERSYPDMKIHVVKNRKGPLGEGNLIKNFANASLIDVPFDDKQIPGDISANIPDLIRELQEKKEKENAA